MPNDWIDPPEDALPWGYTIYGEEIEQGELDVREVEAGRYIKPHEFERYIKDNSRLVNTEELNYE
ncbi:hypothetical protein EFL35_03100 [Weissella paramesenteroides]|uniref:hypothetical protein n=1 Tax=Weissella paramesenteroides TaxID=1249 RepID=UPI00223C3E19|nr:hypothetical protein [Weissella paramesenteroides]MCS9983977.1 hypothetical protein [Weissella paramesenteroides]MCS9998989.1 hypothetical protein [Weissella paramesenteroides]MCT0259308.1 hypothetical protein [Weissella paramesenteroides]